MKTYEQITSVFIFHCTALIGTGINGENMLGVINIISLTVILSSVAYVMYNIRLEFKR
jgi:hypothetical protein